uniref:LOW QUALITY PROTEIN: uncharacterized protein CXorf49-like n=1 Tax=Ictidomys tridecemlineatus TaxID=43179 RepID=UPI001A9E1C8B|nr:LOW QUALITY PROTEIN: uncharacterized protein CXorf49-like [Ictidomys tridecemlineatus]
MGSLPDFEACEFDFEAEWEQLEVRRTLLPGCEGRSGSLADEKDLQDFMPYLSVESETIMQQLMGPETWGALRYPSLERSTAEASTIWAEADADFSAIGTLASSCVEAQQVSAAPLSHPSRPKGSWAWRKSKRGTKSQMVGSGEAQQPSSNPKSSDELSELQLMRVSICSKGGGQARSCSPREPGDPARRSSVHSRENFFSPLPGPLLTSAPRGLPSTMDRQVLGELEAGSSKKMQSVLWGKGGSRSNYPGVAAAATATTTAKKFSSGEPNPRVPQPSGSSQPLNSSLAPSDPARPFPLHTQAGELEFVLFSGEQDPPVQTPVLERQQQPPGARAVPGQCVLLRKEIDDLKEQLGMMTPGQRNRVRG